MLLSLLCFSPDHICNRYCGGSHTVTTPQQRVARVGHFLEQWGPEIAPAVDTQIRGTDGQVMNETKFIICSLFIEHSII